MLHLDQFYQESYEHLQSLVIRNSRRGLDLLVQYSRLYSNCYLSPVQLFCLVHLCDAVVRYDATDEASRTSCIQFCLSSLQQAKAGYSLAGPLQKMFRTALSDYKIPVTDEMEHLMGTSTHLGPEELLEACTRPSYRQPIVQILPNLVQTLGQDFMDGFQQHFGYSPEGQSVEHKPSAVTRGKQKRVDIGTLLNK